MDKSNDVQFMQDYLYHAMVFERYVYTWSQALSSINGEINATQARKNNFQSNLSVTENSIKDIDEHYKDMNENNSYAVQKAKKIFRTVLFVMITLALVAAVFLVIGVSSSESDSVLKTIAMLVMMPLISLTQLSFFAFVFSAINVVYKKYTAKQNSYKYNDISKEQERKKLSSNKESYEQLLKKTFLEEKSFSEKKKEIVEGFNYARKTLSEIYSLDVLDERYRNFVAVSTMYQYLKTGRCVIVKGHGGIIDSYENDLKFELIISNLKDINRKLDVVINNQEMLYDEITKANSTLKDINNEIKSVHETNKKIESNAAVSAAMQEQIAASNRYMANVMYFNANK